MKFKWLIILLLIPLFTIAQRQRIDSLTKLLPLLTDSSKVNCLNQLSYEFYINALSETYVNVQTDSAIIFASKAFNEATKIHYNNGIADALQNLGEIARDRGEFIAAERYLRQSVALFEAANLSEKYSWANVTLGWSRYMQSKFSEAKIAYELAMPYYLSSDNKPRQSMLFRLISLTYAGRGYNEKAFENTLRAIRLTDKVNDARGVISSPENLANLYKNAGEPEIALTYFRIAAQKAREGNPARYNKLMGDICVLRLKLDSAIYYYRESHRAATLITTDSIIINRDLSYKSVSIGEVFMKQHEYDLAISQFEDPLKLYETGNDKNNLMKVLSLLAKCYQLKENFSTSFYYSKRLNTIAQATGARPFIRDAYELYWVHFDKISQTDSAYKYSLKYIAIKDSILSDEYRRNIALSEMRSQDEQHKARISLLQKDQQLSREQLLLQQQKIKGESLIKYILIATTIAFIIFGIFILRTISLKRRNERQQLEHALELQKLESNKNIIEFQQQATELEMQALRAQMNPHFIFNCLSSINRFILINKSEEASDYLTKFSRLIRMALHNSEKSLISLESELDALRLYLDLERLRFKNAFNYSISFINEIDVNAVYIPPLLIQPFAENAIWHGLMHKKETGMLKIQLCAVNRMLNCTILDDGVGRASASKLKSFSPVINKSMGVNITAGRLALINKLKKEEAALDIQDLKDDAGNSCGTKVILTIPYKDLTEITP